MANPENIVPHQFKKGQSGNPKGRPKNRVPDTLVKILGKSKTKKFYSLSAAEVDQWETTVLSLTEDELHQIAEMEECPAYPKGLAKALLLDMDMGRTNTSDKLRDRQYGATPQHLELTSRSISINEAKTLIDTLEDKY